MRRLSMILLTIAVVCGCGQTSSVPFSQDDPSVNISEQERAERIAIDFSRDSNYIVEYLKPYYPELTSEQVHSWEATNALEWKIIDGQKKYFRSAGRNLFRIDKAAKAVFDSINGVDPADEAEIAFRDLDNRSTIASVRESGSSTVNPVGFTIKYTLTVKPDVVPEGTLLKVWMPYPREDQNSMKDIKLISASEPEYKIAPDSYTHKSIYMEKTTVAGEPTVLSYEFSFTGYAEWYDFKPEDVKPYDVNSDIYKEYTSERKTHIIFTDRIRTLADSLTAGIDNPYLKVRSIYSWIVDNYPWASAREYSTIENIPEYVLDNNHGDCGQVGLLLVTLCRAAGIPARWQSGWMLHPDSVNMHDWSEVYYEGIGWVPTDVSFGRSRGGVKDVEDEYYFYTHGLDAYRLICNKDYSGSMYPAKKYTRSETVDFQKGEVEWEGGNLFFNQWSGWIDSVSYNYEVK